MNADNEAKMSLTYILDFKVNVQSNLHLND